MERAVAVKKLAKIFGKKFRYRIDQSAPSKEEREQARAGLNVVNPELEAASKRLEARRKELQDADPQYQELLAAYKKTLEARDFFRGKIGHHKIEVLTDEGFFHHVRAQGDSWEEIFAKLEKDKVRA
jgi:hypothetical protein